LRQDGLWRDERGVNLLDGGAPFYSVYPTADGEYLAVGPLEPEFFAGFCARVGLDPAEIPAQDDVAGWPRLRRLVADRLATRSRDEWLAVFEDSDACVAPVLSPGEAPSHPQLASRGVFIDAYGVRQPAPAPRFSGTPAPAPVRPPPYPGEHTRQALAEWGVTDVATLIETGVAVQATVP
jgi:alpha-methylacyl-CoA racemase